MKTGGGLVIQLVWAAMWFPLIGCVSPQDDPRLAGLRVPHDFALRFHAAGDPTSRDRLSRVSQFVLESDGSLRVAWGRGATARYYPRLTRVLHPREFAGVARFVMDHHLQAEPTSPGAQKNLSDAGRGKKQQKMVYHVEITAGGRTRAFATTPDESPPTATLLTMLVDLYSAR